MFKCDYLNKGYSVTQLLDIYPHANDTVPYDITQHVTIEGIPRKAHQISASNLQTFSIKCTAITFYLAVCVVNDYTHNSSLTIDYFNYGFITKKSLHLEK